MVKKKSNKNKKNSNNLDKQKLFVGIGIAIVLIVGIFIVMNNNNDSAVAGEAIKFGKVSASSGKGFFVGCGNGVIDKGSDEQCDDGSSENGMACEAGPGRSCTYCSNDCKTITVKGNSEHTVFVEWSKPQRSASINIDGFSYGPFYTGRNNVRFQINEEFNDYRGFGIFRGVSVDSKGDTAVSFTLNLNDCKTETKESSFNVYESYRRYDGERYDVNIGMKSGPSNSDTIRKSQNDGYVVKKFIDSVPSGEDIISSITLLGQELKFILLRSTHRSSIKSATFSFTC